MPTVKQLKKHKLKVGGLKEELIARLNENGIAFPKDKSKTKSKKTASVSDNQYILQLADEFELKSVRSMNATPFKCAKSKAVKAAAAYLSKHIMRRKYKRKSDVIGDFFDKLDEVFVKGGEYTGIIEGLIWNMADEEMIHSNMHLLVPYLDKVVKPLMAKCNVGIALNTITIDHNVLAYVCIYDLNLISVADGEESSHIMREALVDF